MQIYHSMRDQQRNHDQLILNNIELISYAFYNLFKNVFHTIKKKIALVLF